MTNLCREILGGTLPMLIHGYDYPVPDGRGYGGGFWILPGPWLEPGFRRKGYEDLRERLGLMVPLIDRFNGLLAAIGGGRASSTCATWTCAARCRPSSRARPTGSGGTTSCTRPSWASARWPSASTASWRRWLDGGRRLTLASSLAQAESAPVTAWALGSRTREEERARWRSTSCRTTRWPGRRRRRCATRRRDAAGPRARAGLSFHGRAPERRYEPGTAGFLYWQCRESALAALGTWEGYAGPLARWAEDRRRLHVYPDAVAQLDAASDLNACSGWPRGCAARETHATDEISFCLSSGSRSEARQAYREGMRETSGRKTP